MQIPQYEVVYVDKFASSLEADQAKENLSRTFQLIPAEVAKISSGSPVVIKAKVALDEAVRYKEAVVNAGGVAWVQEVGPDGAHFERRDDQRRSIFDRRGVYRASAIIPDRRQSCGRRSSDRKLRH